VKNDGKSGLGQVRFRALVGSYGADPARWPAAERQAAEELAATSSEAALFLAEQRRLDEILDRAEDVAPSTALLRRVAEIPVRQATPESPRAWWPFGRFRHAVTALAATAAMGAILGIAVPETVPNEKADSSDASWDDFSTLALGVDLSEELSP